MATSLKSNIYKSLEVYWLSIVGGNLKDQDSRSVSRFPDYTRVIISAIYQDCFWNIEYLIFVNPFCSVNCLWAPVSFIFCFQSFPFFGVVPAIVDEQGNELEGACEGFLVSTDK